MAESSKQSIDCNVFPEANGLPSIRRHITTHSRKGHAIFEESIPTTPKWQHIGPDPKEPPMANFFLAYTTSGFPIDVNPPTVGSNELPLDIERYKQKFANPPTELCYENASILRYVDFAPRTPPLMHSTQSLDYGIVIEGEIELILDSGEKRTLKRGDVCVQRATMHAWRNTSETEWARMVFVLISSTVPVVEGNQISSTMPSL